MQSNPGLSKDDAEKIRKYCKSHELAATRAKAAVLTAFGQPGNMREDEIFVPELAEGATEGSYRYTIGGVLNNTGKIIFLGSFDEEKSEWITSDNLSLKNYAKTEPALENLFSQKIHFPILGNIRLMESANQYDLANSLAVNLGYFAAYFTLSETGKTNFYAIMMQDADGNPVDRKWCSICGAFETTHNKILKAPGEKMHMCSDSAGELIEMLQLIRADREQNPTPRVYAPLLCAWCGEIKSVDFLSTPFFHLCFPCEETIRVQLEKATQKL